MKEKSVLLIIMDGYGLGKKDENNAIYISGSPNINNFLERYPSTSLKASGIEVGLPEGQMGNSEVGHLNIGAGRIVYQSFTLINKSIEEKTFFSNSELNISIDYAIKNKSSLHLIGLLSDGGVHSHIEHFKAILLLCKNKGLINVFIHAFLDGRDVAPRCALKYIDDIEKYITSIGIGKIATVSGRYYAMDRDNRWDRTKLAYDAMVNSIGNEEKSAHDAVIKSYERGEDDEFVIPTIITENDKPIAVINDQDSIINVNFRPDRARQMTWALTLSDFDDFDRRKIINCHYTCMCRYDETLTLPVAFPPQDLNNILGQILEKNNIKQLRIAETEKYAHVTFFFNGQREEPFNLEDRVLIPSPRVPTYDLKPEMSAHEIRDRLLFAIKNNEARVYICNFANCDMVGHTGVFESAVKAARTVDGCVGTLVSKALKNDLIVMITADHGNAEEMYDPVKKEPITAHTKNPVPFILISNDNSFVLRDNGKLADIAPTILEILDIKKPLEMNGISLIKSKK